MSGERKSRVSINLVSPWVCPAQFSVRMCTWAPIPPYSSPPCRYCTRQGQELGIDFWPLACSAATSQEAYPCPWRPTLRHCTVLVPVQCCHTGPDGDATQSCTRVPPDDASLEHELLEEERVCEIGGSGNTCDLSMSGGRDTQCNNNYKQINSMALSQTN